MKRIISIILSVSVIFSMSVFTGGAVYADEQNDGGEVVVIFNSDDSAKIADMTKKQAEKYLDMDSAVDVEKVEEVGAYEDGGEVNVTAAVLSSDNMSVDELIDEANESDAVKYAVPNIKLKLMSTVNDSYYEKLWGIERTKVSDIWDMSDAENDFTGTEKVVAVVDTGVDYTHPDLAANMWKNPYQAKLKGKYGYDFVNGDSDPMDDHGHGSHCSGTIGGVGNNGTGVTGMCQNVKIMALKVLGSDGSGDLDDILSAYSYISTAQDLGVDVVAVNNSWGFEVDEATASLFYTDGELEALEEVFNMMMNTVGEKGAVSVCAAGNSGSDMDDIFVLPAECDSDYVISVAAVNPDGTQAYYSNYNQESVDIAAPGTDVLSTVCYENFDTKLLTDEQKAVAINHTESYEGAVDLSGVLYFDSENKKGIPITSSENSTCSVVEGKAADGVKSLKVTMTDAEADELYAVAIPMDLCGQSKPYVEFMAQAQSDNEAELAYVNFLEAKGKLTLSRIINSNLLDYTAALGTGIQWSSIRGQLTGTGEAAEYLVVLFEPWTDGEYEAYIDDFVMTNTATREIEAMKVKYDTYSGTSMATPHVTGAVALVENYLAKTTGAKMEKDERALAVKNIILDNASDTEAKVKYGELNLSGIKTCPVISSLSADKDKLTITGRNFISGTKVTVNDKVISNATVAEDGKSITVPANYRNYNITVKVENPLGKASKSKFMLSDKTSYSKVSCDFGDYSGLEGNMMPFSDGKNLYMQFVDAGSLSVAMYQDGFVELTNSCIDLFDTNTEMNIAIVSKPVVADGKVYTILAGVPVEESFAVGEEYYSLDKDYVCEYRLVTMSLNPDEVGMCTSVELPDAYLNVEGEALGAYNGNIYLLGGYDYAKESTSSLVYKYNVTTGKWSKPSSVQLPEGRYGGSAIQSGSMLYYAMGAADSGKMPKLLKYNGSKWIMSSVQLDSSDFTRVKAGEKVLNYYDGSVSLVENGVVLNGSLVNGYGDTIKYVSGKYSASKYNFNTYNSDRSSSVAVGKYIYLLGTKSGKTELYRGTFTSGNLKATGTFKHGKVLNIGKTYLPGTKVTYTAKPSKGYKKQTFYVDGKKVSGSVKTVRLTKNIKVKATFKKK